MVERRYLPLTDGWVDRAPGLLSWFQAWYAMQCDEDWEHEYGVTISTLDNPGWSIKVQLDGTPWAGKRFERSEIHRGEHDWVATWKDGHEFHAICGPLNLGEALHAFRLWIDGEPSAPT
jgi:hypothetical protein